ncbi:MAG TPA: hypothetical protein VFA58_01770, partial [Chthoniobacterales bacterium]|nr:hypothetical protein [Chthoniobacterales bacterium]
EMVSDLSLPVTAGDGVVHPLSDPDFALEANGSREHILKWWDVCTAIAAAQRVTKAFASVALMHGIAEKTVIRVYYEWKRRDLDWRALANRAKWPDPAEAKLPAAFVAWVKHIHESHQRETTFRQTHRVIMGALELWERDPHNHELAIPGYDSPPERNPFKGYPVGWSRENLRRRCKSSAYEKAVRRQGPKRASEFLPNARTTRVGLQFGEIIYFDDQKHDTYINLTGVNAKAMCPMSFNALECLSGSCFEIGLKPQIWDEQNDTKRQLDQLDFFWFVMLVLTKHGYNPRTGTTLIWEHGTSNPDKTGTFEKRLLECTNNLVKVDKSGIWRAPEFKAMLFEGRPTGNFRFKAPIESLFNLVRNYSCGPALPAPTGRNPEMAPEESGSADVPNSLLGYNRKLLKLIDTLPVDRFLALKRPVLEWEDYKRIHRLVMDAIDARRDHEIEGWHKLGFTGARYRLGNNKPWIDEFDYLKLPAPDRSLYDQIVAQPGNTEIFKLSPREVFAAHRQQLTRLPMRFVPILAPDRAWSDVKVSQSLEIVIEDKWLDSEPLCFIAKVRNPHGYEITLDRGKKYKSLLNIFDPSKLWIAEAEGSRKGAFIGTAMRVQAACKTDHEAILRQLGDRAHVRSVESVEVRARMQTEAARRVAMREHNRNIIEGGPLTLEEYNAMRDRARTRRKVARMSDESVEELVDQPVEAPLSGAAPAEPPEAEGDDFSAEDLL